MSCINWISDLVTAVERRRAEVADQYDHDVRGTSVRFDLEAAGLSSSQRIHVRETAGALSADMRCSMEDGGTVSFAREMGQIHGLRGTNEDENVGCEVAHDPPRRVGGAAARRIPKVTIEVR